MREWVHTETGFARDCSLCGQSIGPWRAQIFLFMPGLRYPSFFRPYADLRNSRWSISVFCEGTEALAYSSFSVDCSNVNSSGKQQSPTNCDESRTEEGQLSRRPTTPRRNTSDTIRHQSRDRDSSVDLPT